MEERWVQWDKKGLEKARKIGKAAARLFSRKGYLETTMDELATAAGISKGGMYYYFPSKTDVLFFILSRYMETVLEGLEEEVSQIKDHHERLRHVISRHIDLYTRNVPEARVLLHEANCLPSKYLKRITEKERKYFQVVTRILSGLLSGTIPKGRLTAITFTLFGMCNWIYLWYDPKGSVNPGELSEIIYTLFMDGVQQLR